MCILAVGFISSNELGQICMCDARNASYYNLLFIVFKNLQQKM
jgi:hypothetical protein